MSNEIMHDEMKVRRSMEREELKKTDDDDVMMMCADGRYFPNARWMDSVFDRCKTF